MPTSKSIVLMVRNPNRASNAPLGGVKKNCVRIAITITHATVKKNA